MGACGSAAGEAAGSGTGGTRGVTVSQDDGDGPSRTGGGSNPPSTPVQQPQAQGGWTTGGRSRNCAESGSDTG